MGRRDVTIRDVAEPARRGGLIRKLAATGLLSEPQPLGTQLASTIRNMLYAARSAPGMRWRRSPCMARGLASPQIATV